MVIYILLERASAAGPTTVLTTTRLSFGNMRFRPPSKPEHLNRTK